jgi:hypothetical protein
MTYRLILKSLKHTEERITLNSGIQTRDYAEIQRKNWRTILGTKRWIVDRRPGLDTLDHLALTVEKE